LVILHEKAPRADTGSGRGFNNAPEDVTPSWKSQNKVADRLAGGRHLSVCFNIINARDDPQNSFKFISHDLKLCLRFHSEKSSVEEASVNATSYGERSVRASTLQRDARTGVMFFIANDDAPLGSELTDRRRIVEGPPHAVVSVSMAEM